MSTQDQRLTDAETRWLTVALHDHAVRRASFARYARGVGAAVELILAARSVRDDPTLRERIEALRDDLPDYVETFDGLRKEGAKSTALFVDLILRSVLAEHAPADDPTRQAAEHRLMVITSVQGYCSCGQWGMATDGGLDRLRILHADHAAADRLAATPEDGA